MKLSVIIPAYNEERTVAQLIEKVKTAQLPDGFTREILVVNDGSTDNTEAIVKELADDSMIKLFSQKNMGKTAAVVCGFKNATGDIFLIQDADLEYDPSQYCKLLQPIVDGEQLVVYGSRFMGSVQNMRFIIRVANFMTNLTYNILYGTKLTDNNTCFKVFKREALDGIDITTDQFGFDTEVTVKLLQKGIHIHEVPIDYVGRTRAEGKKITANTSFRSYLEIFRFTFNKK